MGKGREEGGRKETSGGEDPTTPERDDKNAKMGFLSWGRGNNIILDFYGIVTLLIIFEASHPALSSALSFPAALSQANVGP